MSKLISGKEALIALANGEDVESRNNQTGMGWNNAMTLNLFSFKSSMFDFRLKPRAITINGIEVSAPEKNNDPDLELLEWDQEYWLVDLANYPEFVIPHKWKGDPPEYAWADRGLIHLSKENAIAHAKALIGANGGTA